MKVFNSLPEGIVVILVGVVTGYGLSQWGVTPYPDGVLWQYVAMCVTMLIFSYCFDTRGN